MALTPSSIRNDLKCGRGSISPGEKCSKGAASKARSEAGPTWREKAENTAINVGGKIGQAATVGSIAAALTGNTKLANALGHVGTAGNTAANVGKVSRGLRTGNNNETTQGAVGLTATAVMAGFQQARRQSQMGYIKRRRGEIATEPKVYRGTDRKNLRGSIESLKAESLPSPARARKMAKGVTNKVNRWIGTNRSSGSSSSKHSFEKPMGWVGAYENSQRNRKPSGWRAPDRSLLDSVWADGFSPELDQLSV